MAPRRGSSKANLDAAITHALLDLAHREVAKVEHARAEHRIGAAGDYAFGEMISVARAARCHQRDIYRVAHRACQSDIEALARAVAVHAGKQDFARAGFGHALRPFHRVEARGFSASMSEYLP